MIRRREILMVKAASERPERLKYVPLEYIENSNGGWINTGIFVNQDSYIEAQISTAAGTEVGTYDVLGDVSGAYSWAIISRGVNSIPIGWGGSVLFGENLPPFVSGVKESILLNQEGITINGELTPFVPQTNDFVTTEHIPIFKVLPQTITSVPFRLHGLTILDSEGVLHTYAPALDSDGVASLYDSATGEFLYNADGVEFTYELKA